VYGADFSERWFSWRAGVKPIKCTHKTICQIAQNIEISKTSVHRIVKRDLKLQHFRNRKAQDLTAADKFAHLFRSKQLLRKYPEHTTSFIIMLFRC